MLKMRLFLITLLLALGLPALGQNDGRFSAVSPSGHTLYYNYVGGSPKSKQVEVAYDEYYSYGIKGNKPGKREGNIGYVSGDLVIPSTVSYNGTEFRVVAIGYRAFRNCKNLTSVSIPTSVVRIREAAFQDCSGLTSIVIPNTVRQLEQYAFCNCYGIQSVVIPGTITRIETGTFKNCKSLESVSIENGVKTIGLESFENCSTLRLVQLPNTLDTIGVCAFAWCGNLSQIAIPKSAFIAQRAFEGCRIQLPITSDVVPVKIHGGQILYFVIEDGKAKVTYQYQSELNYSDILGTLVIPEKIVVSGVSYKVTAIADNAFNSCKGVASVIIPRTVVSIGKRAFNGCGVKTIEIPESVTNIEEEAFRGSGIISIRMPSQVTRIAERTFEFCGNLQSVFLPKGIQGIGNFAFAQCRKLEGIIIPDSVKGIGLRAFESCEKIQGTLVIPNSVQVIGSSAFSDCRKITKLILGNSLKVIESSAFKNCSSISGSLTIPASVISIGSPDNVFGWDYNPFAGCSRITNIVVEKGNKEYDSRNNCNAIIRTKSNTLVSGCQETVVPAGINAILGEAFYNIINVLRVDIPPSVNSIGKDAFYGVKMVFYKGSAPGYPWGASKERINGYVEDSLYYTGEDRTILMDSHPHIHRAVVPNTVKEIRDRAFQSRKNLEFVRLGDSVVVVGKLAFANNPQITSIVIPEMVSEIKGGMFRECINLKSVVIGSGVRIIGSYAFYNCRELYNIKLSPKLNDIGEEAFAYCVKLSEISVPASVKSIGRLAFSYCVRLNSVTSEALAPPSIGEKAFYNTKKEI